MLGITKFGIYVIAIILIAISIAFVQNVSSFQMSNVTVDPTIYKNLEKNELYIKGYKFTEIRNGYKYTLTTVITKENKANSILVSLSTPEDYTPSQYVFESSFIVGLTLQGIEKLKKNDSVFKIEAAKTASSLLTESVPLINADKLWQINVNSMNLTGENQTVCIIDSGVNSTNIGLKGKVIKEKCFCDMEPLNPFAGGCCTNGDETNDNATDSTGHGTHIAGIIASNGTIKGVAFNSKIVAVRITNNTGDSIEGDLSRAIEWCTNNKDVYNITLITTSIAVDKTFASYCDGEPSSQKVNIASNNNLFVSIASGNEGNKSGIRSPSCASNATSVGMTYDSNLGYICWGANQCGAPGNFCNDTDSKTDQITCASNRDSILDLLAPGSIITSTNGNDNGYNDRSGTSQATPHVAGVALLMKQANSSLTPVQIKAIMKRTGKPIYDSANGLTFRRIDAYRSVMASMYDVFVSDLIVLNSAPDGKNVFGFSMFNNMNTAINVSWTLNTGSDTINSNQNITIPSYNETLVFVDYMYANPGWYTINVSLTSSSGSTRYQDKRIFVDKYNLIANNISVLYTNSTRRVVEFGIENNSTLAVNGVFWRLNSTDLQIDSTSPISLAVNETTFVYVDYMHGSAGSFNITAIVDPFGNFTESNESDNSVSILD